MGCLDCQNCRSRSQVLDENFRIFVQNLSAVLTKLKQKIVVLFLLIYLDIKLLGAPTKTNVIGKNFKKVKSKPKNQKPKTSRTKAKKRKKKKMQNKKRSILAHARCTNNN